jgi:hypothetical protein
MAATPAAHKRAELPTNRALGGGSWAKARADDRGRGSHCRAGGGETGGAVGMSPLGSGAGAGKCHLPRGRRVAAVASSWRAGSRSGVREAGCRADDMVPGGRGQGGHAHGDRTRLPVGGGRLDVHVPA